MTEQNNNYNNSIIHQTDHYDVIFNPQGGNEDPTFNTNYDVVNRQYGVCEVRCHTLPSALTAAEQLNKSMVNRSYLASADPYAQILMEINPEDVH